eukprot:5442563-Amphidinium_carterae.1
MHLPINIGVLARSLADTGFCDSTNNAVYYFGGCSVTAEVKDDDFARQLRQDPPGVSTVGETDATFSAPCTDVMARSVFVG